ncbi:MAG: CHASE domain-containing protein, partial [Acidimicrobiia bacterium]|nr:CHASE domain-containing protein [Acidimicrobiia bacterium]
MALICSALVLGLEWAYWRDAASATTRFKRATGQVAATIGRGLNAPIYLGRVNGLLQGRTDADSATLARLAGTLPSNGLVDAVGIAKVQGDGAVVTATTPASSQVLPVGLDISKIAENREALDLARDDGAPAAAESQAGAFPGPHKALIVYPQYGTGDIPDNTADRRAQIQGYLVAVVNPTAVVENSLTSDALHTTGVTVDDGSHRLYASPAASSAQHATVQKAVPIANRTWTVTAWAGPGAVPQRPP